MTHAGIALVAVITLALLTAMSLRANARFKTERQLPMQWGLDGSITWTASRGVALAFTPALAAICLAAIFALAIFGKPRAGQEGLVLPVVIAVAAGFLGAHALHLWMIERAVRRRT